MQNFEALITLNYFITLLRKITLNKTRHLLIENELKNLKIFDLSYIIGKSYFDDDVT